MEVFLFKSYSSLFCERSNRAKRIDDHTRRMKTRAKVVILGNIRGSKGVLYSCMKEDGKDEILLCMGEGGVRHYNLNKKRYVNTEEDGEMSGSLGERMGSRRC